MPVSAQNLTILESVNIVLAVQGEAPVDDATSTAPLVTRALETLYEVSRNEQAKGWWFNQQTTGNFDPDADVTIYTSTSAGWHASLPHEFIYYATIRAARIHQRRVLTSEAIEQFSAAEEAVALATLQQAHVRNSNSVYDFADFPAEIKGLGVDEILFLKGNVEEKIGILRLGQVLAETNRIKTETAVSLTPEQNRLDNEATITTYQDYPSELRMLGYNEERFYALPAHKKTEAIRDAIKLRTNRATVTTETADDLVLVNSILSMLGEAQVSACNETALASELWRNLYDADRTLQNKDWFFNTEEGVELTANEYSTYTVKDSSKIISIDPDLNSARLRRPVGKPSIHSLIQSGTVDSNVCIITIPTLSDYDIRAGDWIYIDGVEYDGYSAGQNAACEGTFQITEVTSTLLKYVPSQTVPNSAGYVNQPQVTTLQIVSRRLYNAEDNDWEWTGSFKASLRYRRNLDDVPQAYLEMLMGVVGLRVAETYPDAQYEVQRLAEQAKTGKEALAEAESRQSDFNIFDNFDTAIIMGRNRSTYI